MPNKLLIVEDNDQVRQMLATRLSRKGFEVVQAANGKDGITQALVQEPDVIIMDLNMPVLDGWEATRLLKGNDATKHIPIIALTAHALQGDREKTMAAGVDDFDIKPIDLPRLLEKIKGIAP